MRCFIALVLVSLSILMFSESAHSAVSRNMPIFEQGQAVSDKELLDIAIKNKVGPEPRRESYVKQQFKEKNTVNAWIAMTREDKLKIINKLKEAYSKNGVVMRLSDSYYVDEINGVLYNSLESGETVFRSGKGMGHIFKAIAVMDGDYDNGKNKVELAKEALGPDMFEFYKATYPKKYEKLLNSK